MILILTILFKKFVATNRWYIFMALWRFPNLVIRLIIIQCISQFCVLVISMNCSNNCCEFSQSKCIIIQIRCFMFKFSRLSIPLKVDQDLLIDKSWNYVIHDLSVSDVMVILGQNWSSYSITCNKWLNRISASFRWCTWLWPHESLWKKILQMWQNHFNKQLLKLCSHTLFINQRSSST